MEETRNRRSQVLLRDLPILLTVALAASLCAYEIFFRGNVGRSLFPGTRREEPQRASEGGDTLAVAEEFAGQSFKDLPWHLVAIHRHFVPRKAVKSIAVDIEFADEVPSTHNLFIVPMDSYGRDTFFYFGAITNCDGKRKGEDLSINLGHAFVFSRWGDKDPSSCRPVDGGYYLASDHEGDHVSVRRLHPWGKGRYTFTLRAGTDDATKPPELWVGAYVYSHKEKQEYFVGALRFPGPDFNFSGNLGAMIEVYDRYPKAFPKSIPAAKVSVGNVRIDGMAEKPFAVIAEYPAGVPNYGRAEGRDRIPEVLRAPFEDDPAAVLFTVEKRLSKTRPMPDQLNSLWTRLGPTERQGGSLSATDKECKKLASEIEAAARLANIPEYARLLGVVGLVKGEMNHLIGPKTDRPRLLFIDPFGISLLFAHRVVDEISRGGSYRFVHLHEIGGQRRALFRVRVGGSDEWDYHDFSFAQIGDESVGVGDITFVTAGESMSELIHRMALAWVLPEPRLQITSLSQPDSLIIKEAKTLGMLARFLNEGAYEDALRVHRKLSPRLQQEKYVCALRVRAARHLGGQEYSRAVEDMRRLYPNDVSTEFLSIDYYIRSKQFQEALDAIDRTDYFLGGDPAMDELRGRVHLSARSFDKARESFVRSIGREPTLEAAYWGMIKVTLEERKFDETIDWLKTSQGKLGIVIGDLTTRAEYGEFVKSRQYQKWLEWQKANPQPKKQ
jgi:hypothetical protein